VPGGRVTGVDDASSTEPPTGPGAPADRGDDVGERPAGAKTLNVHVTLVVVLALCAVAFRFELGRALGGNGLSWAYVFEWPMFAIFGVYMWWSVLHGGRTAGKRRRRSRPDTPVIDPKYAGMLEAWETHRRDLLAAQAEAEGRDPAQQPPPG
jgi:hypothetical protein